MPLIRFCLRVSLLCCISIAALAADKPKLTLDDWFNSVSIDAVRLSPDGHAAVIATQRADWSQQIFRKDLWLYREDRDIVKLTESGHDSEPQWSPDGRWIAFLSDRAGEQSEEEANVLPVERPKERVGQVYLISLAGGEAFPVTRGPEEVHAFSWSPDSRTIYYATRLPWTSKQNDDYREQWKDVIQYRESQRGDQVFAIKLEDAFKNRAAMGLTAKAPADSPTTPGAALLASSQYRIRQMATSPDGRLLAFATDTLTQRLEDIDAYEIYLVDLGAAAPSQPRRLTHNNGIEQDIAWSPDSHQIFFRVDQGSVEGAYRDLQTRVYSVDAGDGKLTRWAGNFGGPVHSFAISPDAAVIAAGRLGTEVQLYGQQSASSPFQKKAGLPGTYEAVSTALHSPRIAFVHSTLQQPAEVYIAESPDQIAQARPISSFNKLFTERDLPQGEPYRWTADDGLAVEGMLIYPPGKFHAKNLPTFVLIHGGPADADGNHFEADWYQWGQLAATNGWLVFQPNYRGSSGYGDKFMTDIMPHLVSKPGRDILAGVDKLVKDGIADPQHLAIGGYSYGGYMTNWLITQTTRFRAAVSGAGAMEHAANWGNDDLPIDDALYLGGRPWENPALYASEAALFQFNKVKTPTHDVGGAEDVRVAVLEQKLMEQALHSLKIPETLLLFPGEGHSLARNPWHGKIKVREELRWLKKYGDPPAASAP